MEKKWFRAVKIVSLFIILQQPIFSFMGVFRLCHNMEGVAYAASLLYILFAIGLFMLKEWVRKSFIRFQLFIIVVKILFGLFSWHMVASKFHSKFLTLDSFRKFLYVISIPPLRPSLDTFPICFVINIIFIYFFTLPKVKEQFR